MLIDFRPPGGVQHAGHGSDGCGHQLVDDALTVSSAKPEQLSKRKQRSSRCASRTSGGGWRCCVLRQPQAAAAVVGRVAEVERLPRARTELNLRVSLAISARERHPTPEALGTSTPKGRRCAWPLLSSCSQPLPLAPPSAAAILRARQGGLLLSNLRSLRVTGLLRTCYSRRGAGAAGP